MYKLKRYNSFPFSLPIKYIIEPIFMTLRLSSCLIEVTGRKAGDKTAKYFSIQPLVLLIHTNIILYITILSKVREVF